MSYEYREIICPYCLHRFMFLKNPVELKCIEYIDKNTGEIVPDTICPKCNKTVIALEHKLEGVCTDDERINSQGIRGI